MQQNLPSNQQEPNFCLRRLEIILNHRIAKTAIGACVVVLAGGGALAKFLDQDDMKKKA